jgi:hypothetical protein
MTARNKTTKNTKRAAGQALPASTGYTHSYDWIRGDHYHCKRCGAVIAAPIIGLEWNAWRGVARIGVCECGSALIEYEHGFIKTRRLRWV